MKKRKLSPPLFFGLILFLSVVCFAGARVKCPSCGYDNKPEDRYCISCAAEMRDQTEAEASEQKKLSGERAQAGAEAALNYFSRAQSERENETALSLFEKAYTNASIALSSGNAVLEDPVKKKMRMILEISSDELKRLRKKKIPTSTERIKLGHEGNSYTIKVRLNETVETEMLLDTGCSDTLLSPDIAKKLGLKGGQDVRIVVADGRTLNAKAVILRSVEIPGHKEENIRATVHVTSGNGLLGMSFFKNFTFKIDPSTSELILEKSK